MKQAIRWTVLGCICAAPFVCLSYQRAAAWQEVNRTLRRLESSIKYEPKILLRSKMADFDAAVQEYGSTTAYPFLGRFATDTNRISECEGALYHLRAALEGEPPEVVYQAQWPAYGIDRLPAEYIERACSVGKGELFVRGPEIPKGHVIAALRFLALAREEALADVTQFDAQKATLDCAEEANRAAMQKVEREKAAEEEANRAAMQNVEREKAAVAARSAAHQKEWPLHVDIALTNLAEEIWVSVITDGKGAFYSRLTGHRHFDARQDVMLFSEAPPDLMITVNGTPWRGTWSEVSPRWFRTIIRLNQ